MARVTHVKKAQQRYETKPVIDPATGEQKVIAVLRKDGSPKTTRKTGREITRKVTEPDLTKPLDNRVCEKCRVEIKVGDPYKWVKPKSGPYGGRLRVRCATCPTWQVWDLSSSKMAPVWQAQSDGSGALSSISVDDFLSDDEFDASAATEAIQDALNEVASVADDVMSDYQEGIDALPESLQEGPVAQESQEKIDALEQWKSDLEDFDAPDWEAPDTDDDEADDEADDDTALADAAQDWLDDAISQADDLINNFDY